MASKEDPSNLSFIDNFSCKICLEILNQPVQCQRNEHYFCKLCITKHLKQAQTCPLCFEELTEETLRPPSRVVAEVVSQFKFPLCNNVRRGCKEVIKPEDLPRHHEVCGFAAVVCSNEGCGETVNREDQSSHENESCKFRKVKCEVCEEEMVYRDYEMHRCFMRKEMDEVKSCLAEITGRFEEMQLVFKEHSEFVGNLKDPLRSARSSVIRQERTLIMSGLIIVAGGNDDAISKSFEVFNWSTRKWTLFEDALFFKHRNSFSFSYKGKVFLCGGNDATNSNRIEYINLNRGFSSSFVFSSSLKRVLCGMKGICCGDRLLTFFDGAVQQIPLQSDSSPMPKDVCNLEKCRQWYGIECFNRNAVIVGGLTMPARQIPDQNNWKLVNSVCLYDTVKNQMTELPPLPYKVSVMATVVWKDNLIILGGKDEALDVINTVLMYNLTTKVSQRLPSMLAKRAGCAAVTVGDVIVVMGGMSQDGEPLKSAEYYVFGQDSWSELPSMNHARENATACVQE